MPTDPAAKLELRKVRIDAAPEWAQALESLPQQPLLQSFLWGEFKARYGWSPERWAWFGGGGRPLAAAQVLRRGWPAASRLSLASILYCPRGPALNWADPPLAQAVLRDLAAFASQPGTLMIKLEPDVETSVGLEELFETGGWIRSTQPVQFSSTMLLEVSRTDEQLLAGMKPKTRYNIRLADRHGVEVRRGTTDDFDHLYDLYAETSVRDGFVIRPRTYYRRAWSDFVEAGLAQPFLAQVEGEDVGGLIAYRYGRRAWYLYGMSRAAFRERMPNHALQWAAIRWARDSGCDTYDFWGAPEAPDPADPLWGVYRFKEGFGARLVRLAGSWDFTARPALYRLYTVVLPRLLGWTRRRQQERTRQLLEQGV